MPSSACKKKTLACEGVEILAASYSPYGELIAAAGADKLVRLLHAGSGTTLATLTGHADAVVVLAFRRDRARPPTAGTAKLVKVLDTNTYKELHTLAGHTNGALAVAFVPEGNTLVSVGADASVRLWDLTTGKEAAVLEEHRGSVRAV